TTLTSHTIGVNKFPTGTQWLNTNVDLNGPGSVWFDSNGVLFIGGYGGAFKVVSVYAPTGQPSQQPSSQPTGQPNLNPTAQPSKQPMSRPSGQPSSQPVPRPSG